MERPNISAAVARLAECKRTWSVFERKCESEVKSWNRKGKKKLFLLVVFVVVVLLSLPNSPNVATAPPW